MLTLRLHDPARRPANWTEIIRPHQFAAFAKDLATGIACTLEGHPFADAGVATCVVFDSFREARRVSEAAVIAAPLIQIDIFDAQGRANPPLLTIVHPDRVGALESGSPAMRRRRIIGWSLIAAAVPLLVLALSLDDVLAAILPGFIAANLFLVGGRLLWFNLGLRETERLREERVARISMDGPEG